MEKVGVEAVVEGLQSFLGGMEKMDKGIASIVPSSTLLTRTLGGLGDILTNLAGGAVRVLEFALGSLLAGAINTVVGGIKNLISGAIEAGNEFQKLEIRLNNLNLNDLTESGMSWNDAQDVSVQKTKEQLSWLQKLANTTPYDAEDIANTYTLARSYDFADQEAKDLTESIADFASGMGLGSKEIERVIINLGQMQQQGKVTQRDLNDLARGAFVPVNDILTEMQKRTGLTDQAFQDFLKTTEGVQEFKDTFQAVVAERFPDAAEKMARTFGAATDNVKDLAKGVLGLNVVKPILDTLGGKVADFMNALNKPVDFQLGGVDDGAVTTRFDKIVAAATRIGETVSGIISEILGMGPSIDGLADGLVNALEGIADWLDSNKDEIVDFFKNVGDTIKNDVVPFVEGLVDKFNLIKDWVTENSGTIQEFFSTLGEILGDVFTSLGGGDIGGGSTEGFLDSIKTFMQYVIDNKDAISQWAVIIAKVVVAWQLFSTVLMIVGGILLGIIGSVVSLVTFMGFLITLPAWVAAAFLVGFALILVAITGFVAGVILKWVEMKTKIAETVGQIVTTVRSKWLEIGIAVGEALQGIIVKVITWGVTVRGRFTEIVSKLKAINWTAVGQAIIAGIVGYVEKNISKLKDIITAAIQGAIDAAMAVLDAHSPSRVFMDIGKNVMDGFAIGIKRNTQTAVDAMEDAVGGVIAPAMNVAAATPASVSAPSSVTTNNNTSNNYNLSVNSNTSSESVVADFSMLKSLGG